MKILLIAITLLLTQLSFGQGDIFFDYKQTDCSTIKNIFNEDLKKDSIRLFLQTGQPIKNNNYEKETLLFKKLNVIPIRSGCHGLSSCYKTYNYLVFSELDSRHKDWRKSFPKQLKHFAGMLDYPSIAKNFVEQLIKLPYINGSDSIILEEKTSYNTIYSFSFNKGQIEYNGEGHVIISYGYKKVKNSKYDCNCFPSKMQHCEDEFLLKAYKKDAYYIDLNFFNKKTIRTEIYMPYATFGEMDICFRKLMFVNDTIPFFADLEKIIKEIKQ